MQFSTLEQAEREMFVAIAADIPLGVWGPPGIGKSSVIKQVARKLGYLLIDLRLSDKEPSDLGGIPYPQEGKVVYLMPERIPFADLVKEQKIIFLLDEFDRARLDVQNAALQILLDREINGHKLGENVRVILAGNASTDVGTTPLSKAAANRMIHIYIEIGSQDALKSFLNWAQESQEVSPLLQGFAAYRQEVWANGGAQKNLQIEDMAYPTPRSFEYADRILTTIATFKEAGIEVQTRDIIKPLLAGCVGEGAAVEFLAYRKLYEETPTREEILGHPETAAIPKEPSILYSLTIALTDYCQGNRDAAALVAQYGLRWPEEPAAYLFRRLRDRQPSVVTTPAYQTWMQRSGRKLTIDFSQKSTRPEIS